MFPESTHLFLSRGKAYFFDGKLRQAYDDFEIAVKKDPSNQEAASRLAQLTATFRLGGGKPGGGGAPAARKTSGGSTSRSGDRHIKVRRRPRDRDNDRLEFPVVDKKADGLRLKLLPGRSTENHVVPPSFGSGFHVMPKSDLAKSPKRINSMRTTRPLP